MKFDHRDRLTGPPTVFLSNLPIQSMTALYLRKTGIFALALFTASCATTAAATQSTQQHPEANFRSVVEHYGADRGSLRRFYNMENSPLRLKRLDTFDASWKEQLAQTEFDSLSVTGRIDYSLIDTELEYDAAKRAELRARIEAASELLPFTQAIFALEEGRWNLAPITPEETAKILTKITEQAKDVKKRVQLTGKEEDTRGEAEAEPEAILIDAVGARWIAGNVSHVRYLLATWYGHYAEYDPSFAWWNELPYENAREALDELAKHLREEIAEQKGEDDDPLIGDPIGREALLIDLQHEWLSYTPEELIAIGEAQFAWCDERLLEASNEMGHGDDWRAALEKVKTLYSAPGEQGQLVANQAREAIAFLKERDLVTIPPLCEETWRVQMLTKRGQRTLPFAAYGGQKMSVAAPTSDMDHEQKLMSMRGNNIHFTRSVTPHELIPGHHLQGFMARRHNSHRSLFRTPFLVEGWALYWEMLEWDEGWAQGPEDRVGMLFWRKHRAARIIVSLKYHLGEMSSQEMIDFLVDRVGHELDNATSEVRRYINGSYSPLYQCGYMIGGLQLRKLREEVVDGGKMSLKEFHDAILKENSIPIELIRASLLGIKLERGTRTSWKPEL